MPQLESERRWRQPNTAIHSTRQKEELVLTLEGANATKSGQPKQN